MSVKQIQILKIRCRQFLIWVVLGQIPEFMFKIDECYRNGPSVVHHGWSGKHTRCDSLPQGSGRQGSPKRGAVSHLRRREETLSLAASNIVQTNISVKQNNLVYLFGSLSGPQVY